MKAMKVCFFVLIFFLLMPVNIFAHTGLDFASPEKDETVKEEISQIEMTFKTKIEDLSAFTLVDDKGTNINIYNIQVDDKVMTGELKSPLESGTYTVNWKIVGLDGHPLLGNYSFSVKLPANNQENSKAQEINAPSSDNQEEGGDSTEKNAPLSTSQPLEDEGKTLTGEVNKDILTTSNDNSLIIYVGIGIVFIVVVLGLYMVKRWRK